jgi:hypothetical protein
MIADQSKLVRRLSQVLSAAAADAIQARFSIGFRPRLSAPIPLVVIPDERQSMPIPQVNDW